MHPKHAERNCLARAPGPLLFAVSSFQQEVRQGQKSDKCDELERANNLLPAANGLPGIVDFEGFEARPLESRAFIRWRPAQTCRDSSRVRRCSYDSDPFLLDLSKFLGTESDGTTTFRVNTEHDPSRSSPSLRGFLGVLNRSCWFGMELGRPPKRLSSCRRRRARGMGCERSDKSQHRALDEVFLVISSQAAHAVAKQEH